MYYFDLIQDRGRYADDVYDRYRYPFFVEKLWIPTSDNPTSKSMHGDSIFLKKK